MSTIISAPSQPSSLPSSSQWLAGQGAGSWFWIGKTEILNQFQIKRFSPKGTLECDRVFTCNQSGFKYSDPFEFTYLSHCAFCTIIQNEQMFTFDVVRQ